MINRYRGDVPFELDGRRIALRLTLGSLAQLEDAFGTDGLSALSTRLGEGRLSARDICHVLAAGFVGAGERHHTGVPMDGETLGTIIPASALVQAATCAAALLAVTFGGGEFSDPPPPQAA